jgi:hypothetical protein
LNCFGHAEFFSDLTLTGDSGSAFQGVTKRDLMRLLVKPIVEVDWMVIITMGRLVDEAFLRPSSRLSEASRFAVNKCHSLIGLLQDLDDLRSSGRNFITNFDADL